MQNTDIKDHEFRKSDDDPEEIENENFPEEPKEGSHNPKRSYYYDDAHGYEEYDSKKDDDDQPDEFDD